MAASATAACPLAAAIAPRHIAGSFRPMAVYWHLQQVVESEIVLPGNQKLGP